MDYPAISSATLTLFAVIDIIGSLPIIINMKREGVYIRPSVATLAAAIIMLLFLFFGSAILNLFGIGVSSFALAGSLIIFFMGLEMILGIRFFRDNQEEGASGSIVPIAFPLVAGAGTITTLLSLKTQFDNVTLLIAIALNLGIVYLFLKSTGWISRKISMQVMTTLRKVFGVLLLAIAIQMARDNI